MFARQIKELNLIFVAMKVSVLSCKLMKDDIDGQHSQRKTFLHFEHIDWKCLVFSEIF